MGRKSHSQTLMLWANGQHVGRWTIPARGEEELQYSRDWLASPLGRPLSLSLPFGFDDAPLKGPAVANYFENLLPDSAEIRRRVAQRFKTGSADAFDLLSAVGRDCVGAIQLLAEGEAPVGWDTVEGVPVDDEAIERHLLEVVTPNRFAGAGDPDDDFRISLAGAQEKDAFLWWNGAWLKPRGATPTTHIFKLPIGLVGGRRADFTTSVDNEWLCMKLLKAYGLDVAEVDIQTFGSQRVLVVERFDRLQSKGRLLRLMQEDFCQATGTSPLVKYENEGGPGLAKLFELLAQSVTAEKDMRTLMASQVLFWLLRATDGHAKNFSIALLAGRAQRFQMTPMYDVMSAFPAVGSGPNQWSARELKLAMALVGKNRHYEIFNIQRRHFNSTARKVGFGESAEHVIEELLQRTPGAIAQVENELPPGFSLRVAESIFGGLRAAAQALREMPSQ